MRAGAAEPQEGEELVGNLVVSATTLYSAKTRECNSSLKWAGTQHKVKVAIAASGILIKEIKK